MLDTSCGSNAQQARSDVAGASWLRLLSDARCARRDRVSCGQVVHGCAWLCVVCASHMIRTVCRLSSAGNRDTSSLVPVGFRAPATAHIHLVVEVGLHCGSRGHLHGSRRWAPRLPDLAGNGIQNVSAMTVCCPKKMLTHFRVSITGRLYL